MDKVWPEWSPQYLLDWIERVRDKSNFPKTYLDYLSMLATDRRMSDFWDWFAELAPAKYRHVRAGTTVGAAIWRLTKLPGKPSNMTPAQRSTYFDKVRKHALALMELLRETKFDCSDMRELTEEELDKPLASKLGSWGEDENDDGHVVAFTVTPDGAYEMRYDYPNSNLTNTLWELYEWTHWDDQWDGAIFTSSAPIVQVNAESARIVYFTCSLYDWFSKYKMEMPFPVLATVANVALALGANEQVDEDAVRKQVRRYQERVAKQKADNPPAFEGNGQNFEELDNSVLSDPF